HTTAEKRKEDLGNSLENLASFLSLAGFVALFLGGVGVGSAIHSHVREKLPNAALLRCIGLGESRTFGIYLAQALALGLLASTLGAFLGLLAQWALPHFIGSLLPVRIPFTVGIKGVAEGFALALSFCMLFALLPLLAIRRMSPWAALRVSLGGMAVRRFPWAETLVVLALVGMSASFAIRHTDKWVHGLSYALGLFGAFAFLTFLASLCVKAARRFAPSWLPYAWRQGLANLHRPNNRTALLVLSLGLGTFVLVTLHLTQKVLIAQLVQEGPSDRPNTLLFDIQPDQREGVESLLAAQGVRVLDQSAIVTLRLESLRGKTIEQMLSDTNRQVAKWALRREYRCTWRSEPSPSEKVTSGKWHPPYNPDQDPIPVSLEEGIARDLGLRLGDKLSFDLQGVELKARVASLRKVEWRRVQPNFFVVFPPGSLEGAPAFHVFVTRTSSAAQSATLQRSVVQKFPNVSAIDLTLVLNTLNAIIDKAASAIRFMALFTVGTGLLVLAGAILSGRHQRMRESALLRTLGASRAQIRGILMAEYASLGLLSAGAGCALAVVASWALARHVFKTQFSTELAALAPPLIIVTALTLVAGWLGSRSAAEEPPLESLRREST
ncbi:MAG: FtsX-like permease family protein, partial [Verrucomicrobia bacterium]|nr:FtsX-like permease family protein [Verrucomicrobiota bacterium]